MKDLCLTQLPLDKMAAILAGNTFKCILLNENENSNFSETCSQESNWQ